nr:adenine-specific methyltransferase EcoRI family protein [Bifidobacterium catenulatum]
MHCKVYRRDYSHVVIFVFLPERIGGEQEHAAEENVQQDKRDVHGADHFRTWSQEGDVDETRAAAHAKRFLVLGAVHAAKTDAVLSLFVSGRIRFGYATGEMLFTHDGRGDRLGNCRWYTNLPVLKPGLEPTGTVAGLRRFDLVDALCVGRLEDIPADYEGRLGIPVFFEKDLSNKNDLTEPPMPCAWR